MKNIFEGAKFGDKFITRDSRKAQFVMVSENYRDYLLVVEGDSFISHYDRYGRMAPIERSSDIVSKYHEEIDEEKLDKLANEFADRESIPFSRRSDIDSFKAGYRKAKEK